MSPRDSGKESRAFAWLPLDPCEGSFPLKKLIWMGIPGALEFSYVQSYPSSSRLGTPPNAMGV